MVSPSKNKEVDYGRENELLNQPDSKKSSKPFRPLLSKKFYLDIKNRAIVSRVEEKLKLLGAEIELFLIKEVNYVVTDRLISDKDLNDASTSSATTPSPLPSPALLSSPADGGLSKKSKTRAEAMLEKVQSQQKHIDVDPLDIARSWNIRIYALDKFLRTLDKIWNKAIHYKKPKVKILKGSYLKLETEDRPYFKEFRQWPNINFYGGRGTCPFFPVLSGSMTRKLNRSFEIDRTGRGYCELCDVAYEQLNLHLVSTLHMQQAMCPETYTQLDSLIKTKTLDAFVESQMCPSLVEPRRSLRSGSVDVSGAAMGIRQSTATKPTTSPSSNGQILPRTRSSTLHLRQSFDDSFTKKSLED